jgi:hypothetical protein
MRTQGTAVKKIKIELSEKEIGEIIDALLFSGSCDICADWTVDHCDSLVKLAKKISDKYEVGPTGKIFLFGTPPFGSSISEKMPKMFPSLSVKKTT